jgi:hypothetical protein
MSFRGTQSATLPFWTHCSLAKQSPLQGSGRGSLAFSSRAGMSLCEAVSHPPETQVSWPLTVTQWKSAGQALRQGSATQVPESWSQRLPSGHVAQHSPVAARLIAAAATATPAVSAAAAYFWGDPPHEAEATTTSARIGAGRMMPTRPPEP